MHTAQAGGGWCLTGVGFGRQGGAQGLAGRGALRTAVLHPLAGCIPLRLLGITLCIPAAAASPAAAATMVAAATAILLLRCCQTASGRLAPDQGWASHGSTALPQRCSVGVVPAAASSAGQALIVSRGQGQAAEQAAQAAGAARLGLLAGFAAAGVDVGEARVG